MNYNWVKHERWWLRGSNFTIEVIHSDLGRDQRNSDDGGHRWCFYAFIYDDHPHYDNFTENDMSQEACRMLPMHSYPSYFERLESHRSGRLMVTKSVKVGCDYNHYGDEHYTYVDTEESAKLNGIFDDAQRLYDWLEACNGKP